MNIMTKCNCCAKESVCKYSTEYKQDCNVIPKNIIGRTTSVRITCEEFSPIEHTIKGVNK